jgi:type IX secretion system PorP/SprF family membrane protein
LSLKRSILTLGFMISLFVLPQLGAQDPIYSQFYNAPLQLNSALAGISSGPRFTINYRNQWPLVANGSSAYTTYSAAYDQYFPDYSSGIGLLVLTDDAGGGLIRTNRASLFYSYNLVVQPGLYLKAGLEAGFIQTRYGWDNFIFGDQLDPRFGPMTPGGTPIPSQEVQPDDLEQTSFDVSFGTVLYSKRYYLGVSLKHLNRPDISILGINEDAFDGLPLRWSLHGGYQIDLPAPNTFVMPNILYVRQGGFSQLNVGAYVNINALNVGAFYRHAGENVDAIIASVGVKKGIFRVAYSYDYTISDLGIQNGGTHEVSLVIDFGAERNDKDYNDCFQLFR